jgi:hypothetical protein
MRRAEKDDPAEAAFAELALHRTGTAAHETAGRQNEVQRGHDEMLGRHRPDHARAFSVVAAQSYQKR